VGGSFFYNLLLAFGHQNEQEIIKEIADAHLVFFLPVITMALRPPPDRKALLFLERRRMGKKFCRNPSV